MPKTASTSIQETLLTAQSNGTYYYPKSLGPNHGVNITGNYDAYRDSNNLTLSMDMLSFHNKKCRALLENELYHRSIENLVISSEEFFILSETHLNNLRDFLYSLSDFDQLKVQIIAYIRDPIELFTSIFQQLVKTPPFLSYADVNKLSDFLSKQETHLESLIRVFGKNNITLFKFENTLEHQYGPVGFFYEHVLKYNLKDIKSIKIQKCNERMSQIAADICIFINTNFPNLCESTIYLRHHYILINYISGPAFQLKKSERAKHLNRMNKSLDYFKNKFRVDYSTDDLLGNIDSSTEPCHLPTEQNTQEIIQIFYMLHPVWRKGILAYFHEINKKFNAYDYLKKCVCTLEEINSKSIYKIRWLKIRRIYYTFIFEGIRKFLWTKFKLRRLVLCLCMR